MTKLFVKWQTFKGTSERGATMVEYGILVALISIVAIAVIALLGEDIWAAFNEAQKEVDSPAVKPAS